MFFTFHEPSSVIWKHCPLQMGYVHHTPTASFVMLWAFFTRECYFPTPKHICACEPKLDALLVTCTQFETRQSDWNFMLQYANCHHSLSAFLCLEFSCSSGICLYYARGREYSVMFKSMAFDIVQKWFEPWQYHL